MPVLVKKYLGWKWCARGNFNTLRIWGGGIYHPQSFYDACDEFGILLYHDLQFTGKAGSVTFSRVVEAEIKHNIRRLSHHLGLVASLCGTRDEVWSTLRRAPQREQGGLAHPMSPSRPHEAPRAPSPLAAVSPTMQKAHRVSAALGSATRRTRDRCTRGPAERGLE